MPGNRHHNTPATPQSYWNERLTDDWGLHGVGSLAYGRNYNSWMYRVRQQAFQEVCGRLDIDLALASVLDVGCGTGFYLDQWQRLGVPSPEGIDFAAAAIERLQKSHPDLQLHLADIGDNKARLPANRYDIISAMDVLFHIVDDTRYSVALHNLHSGLREGGYLLYSDNFLHGPTRQYLDYWKSRTLDAASAALHAAGFDIVRRVPVFVLMNSPVDTQNRAYQFFWDGCMRLVSRSEKLGYVAGACLYPAERLLRRLVREGPSTEIMICRKRSNDPG